MADPLHLIKQPIQEELQKFEDHFRDAMRSQVPLLDRITYYIVKSKGKQVRPMFVFLCARTLGSSNHSSHHAAAIVELLHTATLVHDDVVDEANERRGFFSINALWKNKAAVLVGDYLLSKGLLLALDNNEFRLLQILSRAVKSMSEGELLQMEKARKLNIKESVYYDVIKGKTASLFAAACSAGAASVSQEEEVIEDFRQFGEHIGMAFQIKDDLFDFGVQDVGKPLGIDIKEKKMTLPLIYALQNASASQRRATINLIKNGSKKPEQVREVIQFVRDSGGMEYAQKVMVDFRTKAFDLLHKYEESPARIALENLVTYVTDRKK